MAYNPELRIKFLTAGGLLLFVILIVRLADLQLIRNDHFKQIASAQRQRASELAPHRGAIYMTEGKSGDIFPVASNQKGWIAYAVPRSMEDPKHIAKILAPALVSFRDRQEAKIQEIKNQTGQNRETTKEKEQREEEERQKEEQGETEEVLTLEEQTAQLEQSLFKKFDQRTDPYEPILRPHEVIDEELKQFLEEKNLQGIVLEEQEVRIYPEKELAAHIIGYVGFLDEKRVGRYGVEGFFDQELKGDLGWLSEERDTSGRFIGVAANEFTPALDGSDVVLTVDRVVQSYIEKELKEGVERYGAERGTVIVMHPKTGAILGMATYPTFDPNTYYAVKDARVQSNPAVSDIFEPGSILKPVIMAGAMEEGLLEPDTTFTDSGPVKVAKYTIDTFDGKHHGVQTMTQVLEQSNNIGMVWVGQKMGAETMYDYLRRFGVGERTGIGLDGETQTNLKEPDDWNVATIATTAFGQGVALTPIQAINAINTIANDGKLMQPYIVSRLRSPSGEEKETKPTIVRNVVSQNTAEKISAMMVSVIENGVAGSAKVPGYYLAGKTGTAQVADETGKYSKDKKIITFAGFGTVEEPQFTMLIKLDNPRGLSFASGTAAPMFRKISEKLLNYYQVPPSYDKSMKQPAFIVP